MTTTTLANVTPEEVQNNKQVAATILEQLGGRKFIVMTGSKNFSFSEVNGSLQMSLTRNLSGANRLNIKLVNDLYTMTFSKINVNAKTVEGIVTTKAVCEGVYAEDLQRFFTATTGLYTHL